MSSREACLTCGVSMGREFEDLPCKGCNAAFYCSENCRQEDLPAHQLICGQYGEIEQQPQPLKETHTVAILFPENGTSPRFVWLRTQKANGGLEDIKIRSIDRDFSIGKCYRVSESLERINRGNPRFTIGHGIVMYACKKNPQNYGENLSIDAVMNNRGPEEWKGPFIVVAYQDDWDCTLQHVTMSDYRNVIDFLRTFNPMGSGRIERYDKEIITRGIYVREEMVVVLNKGTYTSRAKGVIINCLGDIKLLKKDKYVAVEIKKDHPAFSVNCTKLSGIMGFGLITFTLPADRVWRDGKKFSLVEKPYTNNEATFMHLDVSAVDEQWGWPNEREWKDKVGSVLVFRKDGKDVTIHQVQAHVEYIREVIGPAIHERVLEESERIKAGAPLNRGETRLGRRLLMERLMTRGPFREYFEKLRKKKIAAGHLDWVDAVFPDKWQDNRPYVQ